MSLVAAADRSSHRVDRRSPHSDRVERVAEDEIETEDLPVRATTGSEHSLAEDGRARGDHEGVRHRGGWAIGANSGRVDVCAGYCESRYCCDVFDEWRCPEDTGAAA